MADHGVTLIIGALPRRPLNPATPSAPHFNRLIGHSVRYQLPAQFSLWDARVQRQWPSGVANHSPAAGCLPPSHLPGIRQQVLPADMVVLPPLCSPEPGEEGLGLIGAGAILAQRDGMINPAHLTSERGAGPAQPLRRHG